MIQETEFHFSYHEAQSKTLKAGREGEDVEKILYQRLIPGKAWWVRDLP